MEFKQFKQELQSHVSTLNHQGINLFTTVISGDELWEIYLESFPPGTNEIFRKRREYDCSCCRHFIKAIGNLVVLTEDLKVTSIWDFIPSSPTYQPVVTALAKAVKEAPIRDLFTSPTLIFGTDKSHEQVDTEDPLFGLKVRTWDHFYLRFQSGVFKQIKDNEFISTKGVFQRSLKEITKDSIETVLDLISQNSLYKGEEWKFALQQFLTFHNKYHTLPTEQEKDLFCWYKATSTSIAILKIRNHSIGTLLTDLSENMDIELAINRYEKIVAPTNYKRPKAVFTKKMVEQAQEQLSKLGLLNSLYRRFATVEDITINNILFANKDTQSKIGDIFSDLKEEVPINTKSFSHTEEVPIQQFLENILPRTTEIEILFENNKVPNLMSLIASTIKGSPTLFKWDNSFSWMYNGNISDSIKQNVKNAGGNVEGVLRFSLQWNTNGDNLNDYDAHCVEPNGNLIYYRTKGRVQRSSGMLDVDIIHPALDQIAVENIIYTDINRMPYGEYIFAVHNFTHRGGKSGFSAEIEFNSQIYNFDYPKELRQDEKVIVAKINVSPSGIKLTNSLPATESTKKVWNLNTNQFHPVYMFMLSPNYWDQQKGIGNKHYFFLIKDCLNSTSPNGFLNEFLDEQFMKHKRVFEALGSKAAVTFSENQLSGLGFSSTKHETLVCRVKGHIDRVIKITF